MDSISLRDIEAIARIESAKMKHFYVGVEHLFIALTKLDGGLTVGIFEHGGQSAPYLRYATRDMIGHGDEKRYWPGYRNTPRADRVLARAQQLNTEGVQPDERALLLAILEEGHSIPMRVMKESGVDTDALRETVRLWTGAERAQAPLVTIEGGDSEEGGPSLNNEERVVLQQMFRKYEKIKIEHIFQGGFSGSTVTLVRPVNADGRSDALVIVKIAEQQVILWEKKRYDSFVKDTLPPTTARIESDPAIPERSLLGGLKYTFVAQPGEDQPVNLSEYAATHNSEEVASFIRESLYNGFRKAWWGQSQPYRFAVWQEYEFLLPPALIVQADSPDMTSDDSRKLHPLDEWSRTGRLRPGEPVGLENFTVQKVKRGSGTLQLSAGAAPEAINRSSQVELRGLDLVHKAYFRGELIRRIDGRILHTRDDLLQEQVQALEPNFSFLDELLPYTNAAGEHLPNPLRRYHRILEQRLSGTLSTIHGDLHTGNILIGPGEDAWLIDFEWTRDGHRLFDWAVLEVSMLIDHICLSLAPDWDSIWQAVRLLDVLNRKGDVLETDQSPLAHAFRPVIEIREIVKELLADPNTWSEYYLPLSMCALRVIGWTSRPLAARRLSFLVSALAMDAARSHDNLPQTTHGGDLSATTDHSNP